MKKTLITIVLVISAILLLGMINSYAQDRGGYQEWPVNWDHDNDGYRHGPGMGSGMMGRGGYPQSQPFSDEYIENYMDEMVENGHMTREEADEMLDYMREHNDYSPMYGWHDQWGYGE